ncbi:putative transcriptional regulator [Synechococcus sp. PCC 7502]|uniref:PadR family transcriptional regulator n=1 Tax=Synechococcus sp. PCC 7502 TaxID=1173263 RepID=UPI00029FD40C|nr:PadR family transcriptional regulator [Synechococcus sp. PCC 7502]AFY72983.1 putative transcriptional regulator [Synechococcus sp. PCC 7502]
MSLGHIILSVLSLCPQSGYDLAKKFDGTVGCYWKASQQQVYKELAKLEERGAVSYEAIPQEGRLDKKVYCLTQQGTEELIKWVMEPSEPTVIRESLAGKLKAAHLVPKAVMIKDIERRRQIHQTNLEHLKAELAAYEQMYDQGLLPPKGKIYCQIGIGRGIRYEKDWVAWCDESLALLLASSD